MAADPYAGAYNTQLADFADDVLIVCPRCGSQAIVKKMTDELNATLSCVHCGFSKQTSAEKKAFSFAGVHIGVLPGNAVRSFGGPVDPYFREALWLCTNVGGELLWAFNSAHLDLLERHISARLRVRRGIPNSNRSLGSRLPGWMTAAGNRDAVLKAIARLRETI